MKHALGTLLLFALCSCRSSGIVEHRNGDLIGLDSFALADRYGTPSSYQHQGEYQQLHYGSEGCRVIFLIDEHQRVTGWTSSGTKCGPPAVRSDVP